VSRWQRARVPQDENLKKADLTILPGNSQRSLMLKQLDARWLHTNAVRF
jgi:hypothetical protein